MTKITSKAHRQFADALYNDYCKAMNWSFNPYRNTTPQENAMYEVAKKHSLLFLEAIQKDRKARK